MDRSAFWHLVEITRDEAHGDQEKQMDLLEEQLSSLPLDELRSFYQIIGELFSESYRPLLWAVAFFLNEGCSDDGFEYFRGWLIAQGAAVFSQAMDNPDTIADVISSRLPDLLEGPFECEEMLFIAQRVYREKTGEYMPSSLEYPSLTREELNMIGDSKTVAQACPRLWALLRED